MVATPIGNLEDITYRAVRILGEVDMIACEDTRVSARLLSRYEISKPLVAIHQHSSDSSVSRIVDVLKNGKSVAYISDAGTPGLADPGNRLVSRVIEEGIVVDPIPGVSALLAIISIAGIDTQTFCFRAFPPHKKGRQTFFRAVSASEDPVVFFLSVHRVVKDLALLGELSPDRQLVIGRELTKMYETIYRGTVSELHAHFVEYPQEIKGEFVVFVEGRKK